MASRLLSSRISRIPTTVVSRRAAIFSASFLSTSSSIVNSSSSILRSKVITRTIMSSSPQKFEWLVIIPDFPGAKEKRLEVRPLHFAGLKPMLESGKFQMGGAILHDVPKDDQPSSLDFAGSTVIAVAESREEVLEILKGDVYVKEGVWDLSKVQMWPLKCAFRIPVPGQGK
ncbi:hypothetical protein V8F06_005884 [Rhypophila decipiens]